MKICNLASGSHGNSTYIEAEGVKILIDAGLSFSDLSRRLSLLNVSPAQIDAIIITHEHSDHIYALDCFCNCKYKAKIYAHNDCWPSLEKKCAKASLERKIRFFDLDFTIGDLIITPIKVSHDSLSCFGYTISENQKKFSILTDLGQTTNSVLSSVRNSQLIFIESNHEESLLLENPKYPIRLKKRILSSRGHLSNTDCANAILEIYNENLKQVVLSHLSQENNSPDLAFKKVCGILKDHGIIEGVHLKIDIAMQDRPGVIFNIK